MAEQTTNNSRICFCGEALLFEPTKLGNLLAFTSNGITHSLERCGTTGFVVKREEE